MGARSKVKGLSKLAEVVLRGKSERTPAQRRRRQQLQQRQAHRSGAASGLENNPRYHQPPQSRQLSGQLRPTHRHTSAPTTPPQQALGGARTVRMSAQVEPRSSFSAVERQRFTGSHPTSSTPAQRQTAPKPFQVGSVLFVSMIRLLILGVGVGAIAGTGLTVWGLRDRTLNSHDSQASKPAPAPTTPTPTIPVNPFDAVLKRNLEMAFLKQQIQGLAAAQPGLTPGMFFLNLDTGAYLDLAGRETFAAASMIKVPVLVAFFQDVDAGKIRLDEQLVMRPDLVAAGSGEMQYKSAGSQFSALDTATKMIVISDNTATNILIDRLGGATALNQRFQSWGLTTTVIRNLLADLEGTNTTSPQDLTQLITLVSQGDLLSLQSRDRLLEIMRQTVTKTLLPQGLSKGATIAHKTGDIGSMVGDTGLIHLPNGQRYVATVMVKRPHNDPRAQALIRQVSRLAYNHLNQPLLSPQVAPARPTPGQ